MISDFLLLEPEERGKNGENYICCLPDPEIYGEYQMIACGRIKILKIILPENALFELT